MLNQTPLSYWKQTGYLEADIFKFCREVEDLYLVMTIQVKADDEIAITISNRVKETKQGHAPTVANFFHALVELNPGRFRGTFVIWLEDGLYPWHLSAVRRVPMFSFSRLYEDNYSMLIPDPSYLENMGYKDSLKDIQETELALPWEKKQPTVFWRGANSGIGEDGSWMNIPRIKLAQKSKEIADIQKIDAAISILVDYGEEGFFRKIAEMGIVKDKIPFNDFLKYRYQIDIDGIAAAWQSLYLKLASQAVVLKVRGDYIQWYYDRIQAWRDYIPVQADLSDLEDIIDWIQNHDAEAKQISANARVVINSMSYKKELIEVGDLLEQLLECQRG